jgi:transcriptional regulator
MHPNPTYRKTPAGTALDLARDRGFGILSVNGETGPLLAHIPFLLNAEGTEADLHLVRSNPIARQAPAPAVIAVSGPDAYISPDWYGIEDQVPTWNYLAVHLRGTLTPLPEDGMLDLLDRQSAAFENRLLPKAPWKTDKLTAATKERFMRMIQPFRLTITSVDSTWKLGQNKPDAARLAAAGGLASSDIGQDIAALARRMSKGA